MKNKIYRIPLKNQIGKIVFIFLLVKISKWCSSQNSQFFRKSFGQNQKIDIEIIKYKLAVIFFKLNKHLEKIRKLISFLNWISFKGYKLNKHEEIFPRRELPRPTFFLNENQISGKLQNPHRSLSEN